jgi:phosphoglycerate dehydrogenase-like enzyme
MEILLHKLTYERVRGRLDALGLDLQVTCVDADGAYSRNGVGVEPEDVHPEVFWLSLDFFDTRQVSDSFDMVLRPGTVKWMQTFNAGLDRGRYREVLDAGVRLTNSSAQAVAISEYVMAQVLNLLHPFEAQQQAQSERAWVATPFSELSQSTWLTIGFGPIGQAVAARARSFGAHILAVRRGADSLGLSDEVGRLDDLPAFLPRADVIVLACALNDATRHVANTEFFKHVKQDAILLNVARGGLVDDAALLACLDAGRLKKAVLDVSAPEPPDPDSPYWSHPRVRLTAHTSWFGDGTIPRGDDLFFDNLVRYVRGEPLDMEVGPSHFG